MDILKVSTTSSPNKVAGAITNILKTENSVTLQAIGAGSINQCVKAMAIAKGFLASNGKCMVCSPSFADIEIEEKQRTAIRFVVEII